MRRAKEILSDSRGLALWEAVVAAALLAALLLAALQLSLRAWDVPARLRHATDEMTELRNACLWVEKDLRRARDVDYAAPGGLSLSVWDSAGGGGAGTVAYELHDGALVRDDMGWRRTVARGLERADFFAEERDGGVLVTAEFEGKDGRKMKTSVWVFTGR